MELTKVIVRNAPFTETSELFVKPVPFRVTVKLAPPEAAEVGLMLVRVSGVFVVLKFAKTRLSSDAVRVSGFVVPVRS